MTATLRPTWKGSGKAAVSVMLSGLPKFVQRGIPRL